MELTCLFHSTAVLSDDDAATGEAGGEQILPELSDDENEEEAKRSARE